MGVEGIFSSGNSAHDKAIKILTSLGNFVKLATPSFNVENSLETFDLIMQGFLLKVAIADSKLASEEIAYVKAVCDKADILERLGQATNGKVNVSWISLKFMDDNTRKKLVVILERVVNEVVERFVGPYAVVDAILDRDVYADIKDAFLGIMAAFAMIDGDGDNFSEHIAIVQSLNVVENAWKKAMAHVECKNNTFKSSAPTPTVSTPQRNSLKAKYETLKKKLINPDSPYLADFRLSRDKLIESILYIETDHGSGTGFIFNPLGYAVTCAHVVQNAKDVYVRIGTAEDAVQKAQVVNCDTWTDMAILRIDGQGYYSATIDLDTPAILGDDVIILGYPFGSKVADDVMAMSVSFTRGYVSSRQIKNGLEQVFLDISAKAGNSGSPVLNKRTGKVIGILCGSITNQSGQALVEEINYMRPIKYMIRMMED